MAKEINNDVPGVVEANSSEWLYASVPSDLAEIISDEYAAEDREKLARAAAEVACKEVREAYQTPFIKFAAQRAARLALGLAPLPQEEGDN